MMKFLFVFLMLIGANFLFSQKMETDSLTNLLSEEENDSSKLTILNKLIEINIWSNPDEALQFAQQKLLIARRTKQTSVEINALGDNGNIMTVLGDYSHAINFFLQSINLAEKFGGNRAMNYLNLSEAYKDAGDYNNALLYAYKGKSLIDTIRIKDSISIFFKEFSLTYIGQVYEKFDRLDSALQYMLKAREMDSIYLGSQSEFTTLHLGNVYAKKGNAILALKYYREVLVISKRQNIQKDLMDAYNGMAKTFNTYRQSDSAVFYANQTLLVGKSTRYPLAILDAVNLLSNIYKSKNILDSTVKYMELSILIKDSLFNREKIREVQNVSFNEQLRQQDIQKEQEQFRSRLKIYALIVTIVIFLLITFFLLRNNRYKQKAYILLQKQKQEIDNQKAKVDETLINLRSTQAQLIQSEKMASLGELTAGIAHEIQNPLNFVNNFAEINNELIKELRNEAINGNLKDIQSLANDIESNSEKINHHGKRAESIVKGMLQHSRKSTGIKEPTDINALADEYMRLSYHGLRAKDKSFNAEFKMDLDPTLPLVKVIPQDIGRVLLNLFNNAFWAANERRNREMEIGEKDESSGLHSSIPPFLPQVTLTTKNLIDHIEIHIHDNGPGIPPNIIDKIFQPFFTTKPTGQGTGLGLSLAYDIIKAHGGTIVVNTFNGPPCGGIKVETKEGYGTEFIIQLPIS
jgi:two-component system, NtrC family, sensor kinase